MSENPLDALKPGDKVAVDRRYGCFIGVVDRRTVTQIIVGNMRFRASNGQAIGDHGFDHPFISVKPSTMIAVERKELESALYNLRPQFSQPGISAARRLLDRAEAFLRAQGEWENKNV